MIDIPPEVQIKSIIKPGSVFYFDEGSFKTKGEPHYFIVINYTPLTDRVILLVWASSKIQAVKRRTHNLPNTTVEIKKGEYPAFTKDSIVNCNEVVSKTLDILIAKLEKKELKLKIELDIALLEKLRKAVLRSPLVEKNIKMLLTPERND